MKTEELLRTAGVSRCYQGFPYFVSAVAMVMEDESCLRDMHYRVYAPLAEKYNVEIKNVERNIRTIRDVVLRKGGPDFMKLLTHGNYSEDMKMYPREIIEVFADFVRKNEKIPARFRSSSVPETINPPE